MSYILLSFLVGLVVGIFVEESLRMKRDNKVIEILQSNDTPTGKLLKLYVLFLP